MTPLGVLGDTVELKLNGVINLGIPHADIAILKIKDANNQDQDAIIFSVNRVNFINERDDYFNLSAKITKNFFKTTLGKTFLFDFVILENDKVNLNFKKVSHLGIIA
mgnify:CR=1 FL=1